MVVDEVETGLKPADGRQRQERSHAIRVAYASSGDDKMDSDNAGPHCGPHAAHSSPDSHLQSSAGSQDRAWLIICRVTGVRYLYRTQTQMSLSYMLITTSPNPRRTKNSEHEGRNQLKNM